LCEIEKKKILLLKTHLNENLPTADLEKIHLNEKGGFS